MNLLALIPIRDWLYLTAIVAVVAAGAGFIHHERAVGAARVEAVRAAEHARAATAAATAIAVNQAETNRRIAVTSENVNVTIQQASRVAADAASTAAVNDRLRGDLAAIRRAATGYPAASGPGAAASSPAVVLADVLERAADRATELARLADERGTAGSSCERQYDALR